jgi:hypothetical protein
MRRFSFVALSFGAGIEENCQKTGESTRKLFGSVAPRFNPHHSQIVHRAVALKLAARPLPLIGASDLTGLPPCPWSSGWSAPGSGAVLAMVFGSRTELHFRAALAAGLGSICWMASAA